MGSASRRSLERASIHSRSSELLVHVPRLGVELLGKFRARLPASIVAGPGPSLDPLYDLGRSPILIASTAGPRAEHGHSVGVTGLRTDSFVDENPNPLEADPGLGHRPDGGGRSHGGSRCDFWCSPIDPGAADSRRGEVPCPAQSSANDAAIIKRLALGIVACIGTMWKLQRCMLSA